jgi:Spy/CpxP family protein refolding chaperone
VKHLLTALLATGALWAQADPGAAPDAKPKSSATVPEILEGFGRLTLEERQAAQERARKEGEQALQEAFARGQTEAIRALEERVARLRRRMPVGTPELVEAVKRLDAARAGLLVAEGRVVDERAREQQLLGQEAARVNELLARATAELRTLRERYSAGHPQVATAERTVRALQKEAVDVEGHLRAYANERERQPTRGRPREQAASAPQPDRWWRDGNVAQAVGVSAEQKNKMDEVFLQYRPKLIDLNGALEKAELAMEPLVGADAPDEAKVTAQIDRVAQARAELEKTTGRMLLSIRKLLTPEQWRRLVDVRSTR